MAKEEILKLMLEETMNLIMALMDKSILLSEGSSNVISNQLATSYGSSSEHNDTSGGSGTQKCSLWKLTQICSTKCTKNQVILQCQLKQQIRRNLRTSSK